MKHVKTKLLTTQLKKHTTTLFNKQAPPLYESLCSVECQSILEHYCEQRSCFFTPQKTLQLFLRQVLSADKSCRNAVIGVLFQHIQQGEQPSSSNTGSYTKARQRLQETMIYELVQALSLTTQTKCSKKWLWKGHEVKVVDGTTFIMPDTVANQNCFPQPRTQAKGCGFPIGRLVAVMSLSTGSVIDYKIGAYLGKGTGESTLLRSILSNSIHQHDILIGDKYYPSYFLLHSLMSQQSHGVFQLGNSRICDFRTGRQLSHKEHITTWHKPKRPSWMSQSEYDCIPKHIEVREFKIKGNVYVTTLLDHKKYKKQEMAELYRQRWQVELSLRNIKTTLGMESLRCKSPSMVRKEIGVFLLGYNLMRAMMVNSAKIGRVQPMAISFKATLQWFNQSITYLNMLPNNERQRLFTIILKKIALYRIGERPGRTEPRVLKLRKKPYALMQNARQKLREQIIAQKSPAFKKCWA